MALPRSPLYGKDEEIQKEAEDVVDSSTLPRMIKLHCCGFIRRGIRTDEGRCSMCVAGLSVLYLLYEVHRGVRVFDGWSKADRSSHSRADCRTTLFQHSTHTTFPLFTTNASSVLIAAQSLFSASLKTKLFGP